MGNFTNCICFLTLICFEHFKLIRSWVLCVPKIIEERKLVIRRQQLKKKGGYFMEP